MVTLLDERQTAKRLLQHLPILVGIALLIGTSALVNNRQTFNWGLATLGLGLASLAVTAFIEQRWEVAHKGHRIRYVNNPYTGEKLFVDDRPAVRGKIGIKSEMRVPIASGDGQGDTIVAQSEAGLFQFRCRIFVEPASMAGLKLSNDELLAEVQRRGLRA
jgi:hypothetical protein